MPDYDLVIAGAGMVGVSSALWAQKRGLKVALCDPNPPGSGASFGNACTIATYACMPVNNPSVLRKLPKLLFGSDSPLSVNYAYALRNPRWMLSFLANCRAEKSREIATALAGLLGHADAGLNPLIAEAACEDLIVSNDMVYVWSTKDAAQSEKAGLAFRRSVGIQIEDLTSAETLSLEPGIGFTPYAGARFVGARHIHDPQEMIRRMVARFVDLGGTYISAPVTNARALRDSVVVKTGGNDIVTRKFVVAAGAFSKSIEGSGAEHMPLGTERGYHLMYSGEGHRISRPVGWAEAGFYAVPMAQGLRLAGTVEIAANDAPVNQGRLRYIEARGRKMFRDLPRPDSHWLGHRPTFPDSLPAIGRSPTSENIIFAFGHQHIGLTLGGITGRIVADLAENRAPNIPISAFSPDRKINFF